MKYEILRERLQNTIFDLANQDICCNALLTFTHRIIKIDGIYLK